MLQCNNNCACRPVCKEVENWKKYCEDHIRLRERSVLFDSEPQCPYYINKGCVANSILDMGKGVIHSKEGSRAIIDSSPYDPKKQKENKIWINRSDRKDEPYKVTYNDSHVHDCIGSKHFMDMGKLNTLHDCKIDCEDEIMATKEPEEDDLDVQIVYYEGQPIAKITHKKDEKENCEIQQICIPTKELAENIGNELKNILRRVNMKNENIK